MKKPLWLVLVLGLAFAAQGCGFDPTIDSSVMIVKVTPTPEVPPTPEVQATPTPEATPTPAAEQTASGVNVEVKTGTYYAASELNLRSDASADADLIASVAAGTQLNSTGVCDNGWIRIDYNGQTCYASGDFVTTTAPAGDVAADTSADTSTDTYSEDTSYDESSDASYDESAQ